MKDKILPLLTPAGNLTCAKAMEIATSLMKVSISDIPPTDIHGNERWIAERNVRFINLLQSYEALLNKKLSKEMFVCEATEPYAEEFIIDKHNTVNDLAYREAKDDYELAQSKVFFEWFEKAEDGVSNGVVYIEDGKLWINGYFKGVVKTLRSLFLRIELYNETATSKIELKFTENILKELGL